MALNRRDFLSVSGKSLIGLTLGGNVLLAHAREKPELEEDNPQAKAMEYKKVSEVEGQNCANCAFVATQKGAQLNCPLFQQHTVAAEGWCNKWVLNPQA